MADNQALHRQIVLDTETTGRDPKNGHRVIEIGCVELIDRVPTGKTYHVYLNPVGATMEAEAEKIHGLSMEFLSDKQQFSQIADEFSAFVKGSELLIHNAPFDVGFLNAELLRVGKPPIWTIAHKITDTYIMAQSVFPKQANGLDKLCARLEIDNSHRELHGALLDAQLLADVYLKMTNDQSPYIDDAEIAKQPRPDIVFVQNRAPGRLIEVSAADMEAHEKYLDGLEKSTKKPSVWRSAAAAKTPAP